MKNLKNIVSEINELTTNIETNYPELYTFLNENPLTIPSTNHPQVNKDEMEMYLLSLKNLLMHHLETHEKVKS